MKNLLKNIALAIGTLLVFGLVCELVVFRYIFRPSDIPRNAYIDGVIRYRPDQSGTYRIRNEIAARYRINAQGWNSSHAVYDTLRTPGRGRIVIVGDSFVEALQVDFEESVAEVLEECTGAEVYRFGLSGSTLSQYIHVVRSEAARYAPDCIVIVAVHNDFIESYRLRIGRYTSSFARYRIAGDTVTEIAPRPYEPRLMPIRGSASYRFLVDRMRLRVRAVKEIFLRRRNDGEYAANIRRLSLADEWPSVELVANHFFTTFADLAEEHGFRPVVLIDGARRAIYRGEHPEVLRINSLCERLGELHGVEIIDMHPVFMRRYTHDGRPFEFKHDNHWNAYAHGIVAGELCELLKPAAETR